MLYTKIIVVVLMFVAGLYMVFDNGNGMINKETTQEDVSCVNETKKIQIYKDVFKEKNQINKFEELQNLKNLNKLDQESEKIIAKNVLIIKNNNLVLPHKELSLEEKEKRKQQDEELEKLKQKIEELSREN